MYGNIDALVTQLWALERPTLYDWQHALTVERWYMH